MSLELSTAYVESFLASEERGRAGFSRTGEDVEVVPGLLYRHRLRGGPRRDTVSMSVFLGVGGLGGALWDQEMRTLERLGGFDHPSLPRLMDGGRLEGINGDAGAAYVRTYLNGTVGTGARLSRLVDTDPGALLSHLWLLADALGLLHEASISHRGLWPGALVYQLEETDDKDVEPRIAKIQLARFEMSALLANMFRSHEDGASYDELRQTYLLEDSRSLLYCPPERLDFVFARENGVLSGPAGDVFSLGMIAAEWLSVDRPEEPKVKDHASVTAYQAAVRGHMESQRSRLPGELVELIRGMLDPTPRGRPTAYQVVQGFAVGYSDARERLKSDSPELPYLVCYMPDQTDQTLLNWKVVQHSASTDEGLTELAELVERDMQGAEVLWSPDGAFGFASGNEKKLRRANTVVVGPQITWFCEPFWCNREEGGTAKFDEIMVIKFVRETRDIATMLDRLRVSTLSAVLPMVDAASVPRNDFDEATDESRGRPLWTELVKRVEGGRTHSPEERDYLASLEWYLQYQQAMLEARTYAFVVEGQSGGRARLRWDEATDQQRRWGTHQVLSRTAVLDSSRLAMAVFVGNVEDDLDRGRVEILGEGDRDWKRAQAYDVVDDDPPNIVVVSTHGGSRLPERGWLRLARDSGTGVQLDRQRQALLELGSNRVLLRQLIAPTVNRRVSGRWADAGASLKGEGPAAVREMLEHDGLFALQGPPGTGKTEVTSEAVATFVDKEPISRVLVSAQSHDALDNLAERITRKLGITVPRDSQESPRFDRLALRVQSGSAGRPENDPLAVLTPSRMAASVVDYSTERARQWLTSRSPELQPMIPVVQRWLRRAPGTELELARRVRGAANVIFATTGASTRRNLFVDEVSEPFHWVVVEEAGRAWPTELALPLVRGLRWTLVGDQAQIGAYSRSDVLRFLDGLAGYQASDEDIREMYEARERHSSNFATFARFFDRANDARPVQVLSEQYRMDEVISALVGEIFYDGSGGLTAMRQPGQDVVDEPYAFRGKRIVWIDTGRTARCRRAWSNEFEADLVTQVVRAMRPEPGRPGNPSLAVLTPYRDQVELLQGKLNEHRDRVFTVDGYQGREADVVVASLVRDRAMPGDPTANAVGHVADPGRTNVLLSRARDLLVIVGRLDVFSLSAGKHWRSVTARVIRQDAVLDAQTWREG